MPRMEDVEAQVAEETKNEMAEDKAQATRKPRSSSFREKEGDPGFLVAKGRFLTDAERELKGL